ncbi:hypothetical protein DPX16_14745 [Anabarilius grahami]|uniref:Uncharacterized protein n=1 Tax=Anabarilius grahami TaxID=495550 RepID=A0A3N0XP45_ANAGA|nr:hypothetical protein DPX16_14745 [Anabarilius grahami]
MSSLQADAASRFGPNQTKLAGEARPRAVYKVGQLSSGASPRAGRIGKYGRLDHLHPRARPPLIPPPPLLLHEPDHTHRQQGGTRNRSTARNTHKHTSNRLQLKVNRINKHRNITYDT